MRSRSDSADARPAFSDETWSSSVSLPSFSSDSNSLSCAILALSCSSALSLPVTSCDRKNCTTRNTDSRNTIANTSVDSASTKPGQYWMAVSPRRPRASAVSLTLLGLTRDALQQAPDLAVLLALAVGPFADHLLLGPHMRAQRLDGFGEARHRRGGAAAAAAFLEHGAQALDDGLKLAAGNAATTAGGDSHLAAAIFAHGGGKPV